MDGKVLDDDAVAVPRRSETADAEGSGRQSGVSLRAELEGVLRAAGVREEHRDAVARMLGWDGRAR